jgi:hypothetical protein
VTALEIRLIAYAILALGLIGGSAWAGHKLTAMHYEALIARDKAAQDKALQSAQQRVIDAQAAQAVAEHKAESDHEVLVQADTTSRNAILGSVRSLETALHLGSLSASLGTPGKPGGTTPVPGSTDGLEDLVERVNAATERAVSACQHDSSELASVLEIAPH